MSKDNNKHVDRPILITGCARSGTSIIAGITKFCGAWGGQMTGATRFNKKGQFENTEIRNGIVKVALRSAGLDPLGQDPLPDPQTWVIDPAWRNRVVQVIRTQGYPGGPWFYKGAKMCLFWSQWSDAFPNARWILVRRDPEDIVSSCLKTGFMRAYNSREGWMKWVNVHLKRFEEMHLAGLDVVEVWPSKIIAKDYEESMEAMDHIGLGWNQEVIEKFITPRLWSGKKGDTDGKSYSCGS